jgi:1-acyl-sn-glycerol-3-phosphate acyltransferase
MSRREPSRARLYLRASAFWVGAVGATIVVAVLVLLSAPFPRRARYRVATLWTRFNTWWLGVTCDLRYRVEGLEHIGAVQGAGIVLSKHQSTWETMVLQSIFPPQVWVLKRELMWIPFFGWGLWLVGPIAIRRDAGRRAVEQLVEQGRERLDQGWWVVIFPEGTRVRPGESRRYKLGGAILASATGRAVVPVAHNAGEYWPRHSFIKRPGLIEVRIGPPIETRDKAPERINAEAREWIEARMRELSPDAYAKPVADPALPAS